MRVFLLGTLSAVLLGLLIGAGSIVRARRGHVVEATPEVPEDRPPPSDAPARDLLRRESLPVVGASGCHPRAGWACWRGRLRLSTDVARGWRTRRAEARAARDAADDDEGTTTREGHATPPDETGSDGRPTSNDADVDIHAIEELADMPLPPEVGFRAFFDVRVFGIGDGNDDDPSEDQQTAGQDSSSFTLNDDGTFEVHVPPGRYGLAVQSQDDLVTGGRDEVRAVAGASEDGLDITLEPTVALVGRVLDEDGVLTPATVSAWRIGDDESVGMSDGDGTFRFEGLRAGSFRLTAEVAGERTSATVVAPTALAVLRVPRPRAGLLLLPRGSDGHCQPATVVLTPHGPGGRAPAGGFPPKNLDGAIHQWGIHTTDCQVVIEPAGTGSAWDVVVVGIGLAPVEARVQFDGQTPATPACLVPGCSTAVAALRIDAIDADGRDVGDGAMATVSWAQGLDVQVADELPAGFPANQSVTVKVEAAGMAITRQVWLMPGMNRAVIPFPVRVASGRAAQRLDRDVDVGRP